MEACMQALALEVEPEVARDAFSEAAAEEGLLRGNLDGPLGKPLPTSTRPKAVRRNLNDE
ncbi:DUF982 domain-containing protein [Mesorhizobium caraganae]|uniref:DUF982 domain-containing protein n=1 Tax=Mesorhizobium caraganae TaxID=483206 RepID=UPI00333AC219